MLLHFKKSDEILETWSPYCKNLAFQDPPSLKFHNRTDINAYEMVRLHVFLVILHKVIWEAKFFLDTKTAYLKALLYYYGDIHTSEKFIFERKWTYHLQYDTIPRYKGYQVIYFCLYALIF